MYCVTDGRTTAGGVWRSLRALVGALASVGLGRCVRRTFASAPPVPGRRRAVSGPRVVRPLPRPRPCGCGRRVPTAARTGSRRRLTSPRGERPRSTITYSPRGAVVAEVCDGVGQRTAPHRLVDLGQLPRHGNLTVGRRTPLADRRRCARRDAAPRTSPSFASPRRCRQTMRALAPGARQEALEHESRGVEPTDDQCHDERGGARHGGHRVAGIDHDARRVVEPGSEIPGVPASVTSVTVSPASSSVSTSRAALDARCARCTLPAARR